jgi:trans-aconitate 2-methyltransferase
MTDVHPDRWDPGQYLRFREQRREPWRDLVAMVEPAERMRVVDLGCGPGELTAELHRKLDAMETVGIDVSKSMLEVAEDQIIEGVRFEVGDLASYSGTGSDDLVFCNSALHWVGDHPGVIAHWAAGLSPHGQIAVQVPANDTHPSHLIADQVASEEPFKTALGGYQRGAPVLDPADYDELFYRLGFPHYRVEMRVYGHVLASVDEVVEWVKGALMVAYGSLLDGQLYQKFLDRYRERLHDQLGAAEPYYYSYKRILMWASRKA